MTVTTTGHATTLRRVTRTLSRWAGRVERRLLPGEGSLIDPTAVTSASASSPARDDDTVELLRPDTSEPAARRARRQARAYLDRRRDKLSEDLDRQR